MLTYILVALFAFSGGLAVESGRQARGEAQSEPTPYIVFECKGLRNPKGDLTTYYIFSDDMCGQYTAYTDVFLCDDIKWGPDDYYGGPVNYFSDYRAAHCNLIRE